MNAPKDSNDVLDDLRSKRAIYYVIQIMSLIIFAISAGVTLWNVWEDLYGGVFGNDSLFTTKQLMLQLYLWPVFVPAFIGLVLFRDLREGVEEKIMIEEAQARQ